MRSRRSYQTAVSSGNRDDCAEVFVVHVHQLLHHGYNRLDHPNYATEQEPAITGDLAESIEAVLQVPSERWMRFFRIHDDPPENEPKSRGRNRRKGKKRRRVDLKFDCSETSPYLRFRFEAKRLGSGNPASKYVGPDGIEMFLSGGYGADDPYGGGLAYVQSHDERIWADRISKEFDKKSETFRFKTGGNWASISITPSLKHMFVTEHLRANSTAICIYHTLLLFTS